MGREGRYSLAPTRACSSDSWGNFPMAWQEEGSPRPLHREESTCNTVAGSALLLWDPPRGA